MKFLVLIKHEIFQFFFKKIQKKPSWNFQEKNYDFFESLQYKEIVLKNSIRKVALRKNYIYFNAYNISLKKSCAKKFSYKLIIVSAKKNLLQSRKFRK